MARISRDDSNLFDMPRGAYLRNKRYVYVNTSNRYVPPSEKKSQEGRGYTDHTSVCIGVIKGLSGSDLNQFYANANYHKMFLTKELPDPPKSADSLSAGLHCWISEASFQSGLTDDLAATFGEEDTAQILDLCAYMLSRESAVMQHVPAWARDHMLFSQNIQDDTFLGRFIIAALAQKSMVTNRIFTSGNPIAGASVDFGKSGFAGIKDFRKLLKEYGRRQIDV